MSEAPAMDTERSRCKNCKRWAPPNAVAGELVYGKCRAADGVDGEPISPGAVAFASSGDGYSGAELMTKADFGCSEFESREETSP